MRWRKKSTEQDKEDCECQGKEIGCEFKQVVRAGLAGKVMFEQRLEWGKEVNSMNISGEAVLGRENNLYKGWS